MDRVLQGAASTISATFYLDGVATDPTPDSATVHITRSDGTDVVAAGTAGTGAGTGKFTYALLPAHTALLDTLTVRWTTVNLGSITTTVEVVGGFLFAISEARALKPLDNTTDYPAAKIAEYRTLAEDAFEEACGVAFVPRYTRETVETPASGSLVTRWPRVRAIRAASVDGDALTVDDLTGVIGDRYGVVHRDAVWGGTSTYTQTVVGYEHGFDRPPPRVSRAVLLLAKAWLVRGPVDERTTSMSTDEGTFSLATPGLRGSVFGIPEVDQVVSEYRMHVGIA